LDVGRTAFCVSMWVDQGGELQSLPFGYYDAPEDYTLPDEPHGFGMWYYGRSGDIVNGSTDLTKKPKWANGQINYCRCGNNFSDVSERYDITACAYSTTEPPPDPCEGDPIFHPLRPTVLWPRCMNIAVCFKFNNIQSPTPCPYLIPLIYQSGYIFKVPDASLPPAVQLIEVDLSNGGLFDQLRFNVRVLISGVWTNLTAVRSLNPSAGIPPTPTTVWCYYGVSIIVTGIDSSACSSPGVNRMGLIVQPNSGTPCSLQCF